MPWFLTVLVAPAKRRFGTMLKVVLLQCGTALFGVLLAWVLFGSRGALSALCGGVAIVLPTLFFVWRLTLVARRPGADHVSAFLMGELVKVGSAIGILVLVRLLFPGAHWGAVVLGLICTLQANFVALLVNPKCLHSKARPNKA